MAHLRHQSLAFVLVLSILSANGAAGDSVSNDNSNDKYNTRSQHTGYQGTDRTRAAEVQRGSDYTGLSQEFDDDSAFSDQNVDYKASEYNNIAAAGLTRANSYYADKAIDRRPIYRRKSYRGAREKDSDTYSSDDDVAAAIGDLLDYTNVNTANANHAERDGAVDNQYHQRAHNKDTSMYTKTKGETYERDQLEYINQRANNDYYRATDDDTFDSGSNADDNRERDSDAIYEDQDGKMVSTEEMEGRSETEYDAGYYSDTDESIADNGASKLQSTSTGSPLRSVETATSIPNKSSFETVLPHTELPGKFQLISFKTISNGNPAINLKLKRIKGPVSSSASESDRDAISAASGVPTHTTSAKATASPGTSEGTGPNRANGPSRATVPSGDASIKGSTSKTSTASLDARSANKPNRSNGPKNVTVPNRDIVRTKSIASSGGRTATGSRGANGPKGNTTRTILKATPSSVNGATGPNRDTGPKRVTGPIRDTGPKRVTGPIRDIGLKIDTTTTASSVGIEDSGLVRDATSLTAFSDHNKTIAPHKASAIKQHTAITTITSSSDESEANHPYKATGQSRTTGPNRAIGPKVDTTGVTVSASSGASEVADPVSYTTSVTLKSSPGRDKATGRNKATSPKGNTTSITKTASSSANRATGSNGPTRPNEDTSSTTSTAAISGESGVPGPREITNPKGDTTSTTTAALLHARGAYLANRATGPKGDTTGTTSTESSDASEANGPIPAASPMEVTRQKGDPSSKISITSSNASEANEPNGDTTSATTTATLGTIRANGHNGAAGSNGDTTLSATLGSSGANVPKKHTTTTITVTEPKDGTTRTTSTSAVGSSKAISPKGFVYIPGTETKPRPTMLPTSPDASTSYPGGVSLSIISSVPNSTITEQDPSIPLKTDLRGIKYNDLSWLLANSGVLDKANSTPNITWTWMSDDKNTKITSSGAIDPILLRSGNLFTSSESSKLSGSGNPSDQYPDNPTKGGTVSSFSTATTDTGASTSVPTTKPTVTPSPYKPVPNPTNESEGPLILPSSSFSIIRVASSGASLARPTGSSPTNTRLDNSNDESGGTSPSSTTSTTSTAASSEAPISIATSSSLSITPKRSPVIESERPVRSSALRSTNAALSSGGNNNPSVAPYTEAPNPVASNTDIRDIDPPYTVEPRTETTYADAPTLELLYMDAPYTDTHLADKPTYYLTNISSNQSGSITSSLLGSSSVVTSRVSTTKPTGSLPTNKPLDYSTHISGGTVPSSSLSTTSSAVPFRGTTSNSILRRTVTSPSLSSTREADAAGRPTSDATGSYPLDHRTVVSRETVTFSSLTSTSAVVISGEPTTKPISGGAVTISSSSSNSAAATVRSFTPESLYTDAPASLPGTRTVATLGGPITKPISSLPTNKVFENPDNELAGKSITTSSSSANGAAVPSGGPSTKLTGSLPANNSLDNPNNVSRRTDTSSLPSSTTTILTFGEPTTKPSGSLPTRKPSDSSINVLAGPDSNSSSPSRSVAVTLGGPTTKSTSATYKLSENPIVVSGAPGTSSSSYSNSTAVILKAPTTKPTDSSTAYKLSDNPINESVGHVSSSLHSSSSAAETSARPTTKAITSSPAKEFSDNSANVSEGTVTIPSSSVTSAALTSGGTNPKPTGGAATTLGAPATKPTGSSPTNRSYTEALYSDAPYTDEVYTAAPYTDIPYTNAPYSDATHTFESYTDKPTYSRTNESRGPVIGSFSTGALTSGGPTTKPTDSFPARNSSDNPTNVRAGTMSKSSSSSNSVAVSLGVPTTKPTATFPASDPSDNPSIVTSSSLTTSSAATPVETRPGDSTNIDYVFAIPDWIYFLRGMPNNGAVGTFPFTQWPVQGNYSRPKNTVSNPTWTENRPDYYPIDWPVPPGGWESVDNYPSWLIVLLDYLKQHPNRPQDGQANYNGAYYPGESGHPWRPWFDPRPAPKYCVCFETKIIP